MRVRFVVLLISSRGVIRIRGSGVRHGEDALKRLDFTYGLFDMHGS